MRRVIEEEVELSLPGVVHPCNLPLNPDTALLGAQDSVNTGGEHSSRVDDDFELNITALFSQGLLVEMIQDIHSRKVPPKRRRGRSGSRGGWRQHHIFGKHVILKPVALVDPIFLLQQRQQLQPTGMKIKVLLNTFAVYLNSFIFIKLPSDCGVWNQTFRTQFHDLEIKHCGFLTAAFDNVFMTILISLITHFLYVILSFALCSFSKNLESDTCSSVTLFLSRTELIGCVWVPSLLPNP